MRWLSANWIWIVAIGGMVWMHLGMHSGHGGHGRSPQPEQEGISAGHESQGISRGHESRHQDDPATGTTGAAPDESQRHRGC